MKTSNSTIIITLIGKENNRSHPSK